MRVWLLEMLPSAHTSFNWQNLYACLGKISLRTVRLLTCGNFSSFFLPTRSLYPPRVFELGAPCLVDKRDIIERPFSCMSFGLNVRPNHAFENGRSQAWLRTLAHAVQRER